MTIRIFCLSQATTPITHMAGTEGNEAVISRQPVSTAGGVRWVPYLSGNAMRACTVRQPGMRWLIDRYGLGGKLHLPLLNFLLHGGALTESTGRENIERVAAMHELWPLLRVLGGSLPDQILSGLLRPSQGLLVCEENRRALTALLPAGFELPAAALMPAEALVQGWEYKTYDAGGHEAEMVPATPPPEGLRGSSDVRMIYNGQAVMAGAWFLHDYLLPHGRDVDAGAVLWSLHLWQEQGGIVGGMGAKGHGRLRTQIHLAGTDRAAEELAAAYHERVDASQPAALAWLQAAFAAKPKKGEGAAADQAAAAGEAPKRGRPKKAAAAKGAK